MSTIRGYKSTKKTCMFPKEHPLIPLIFGIGVNAMEMGAKWATPY